MRPDFDGVRFSHIRKYLLERSGQALAIPGCNVILYASGWIQKQRRPNPVLSIGDEDIHALMEVSWGQHTWQSEGPDLDADTLQLSAPVDRLMGGLVDRHVAIVSINQQFTV